MFSPETFLIEQLLTPLLPRVSAAHKAKHREKALKILEGR
jgi:hypothetical protein